MTENYYNTNGETGTTLAASRKTVNKQEQKVLDFFAKNPTKSFGPSNLFCDTFVLGSSSPLTSVRRAITNLTKEGYLIKTDEKQTGAYGKAEHLWTYNN